MGQSTGDARRVDSDGGNKVPAKRASDVWRSCTKLLPRLLRAETRPVLVYHRRY